MAAVEIAVEIVTAAVAVVDSSLLRSPLPQAQLQLRLAVALPQQRGRRSEKLMPRARRQQMLVSESQMSKPMPMGVWAGCCRSSFMS